MGARSTAREAVLQMLFAVEISSAPPEQVIRDFWRETPGDPEGRAYADDLFRSIVRDLEATDAQIRNASKNWRLERMTRVDRNVLRVGAYELVHMRDVPRAVILDEAVEIAKRFGTEESGAFVNGVLDRIADDCGRTATDADRLRAAALRGASAAAPSTPPRTSESVPPGASPSSADDTEQEPD